MEKFRYEQNLISSTNWLPRTVSETRNIPRVDKNPRHELRDVVASSESLFAFDIFVLDAGDTSCVWRSEQCPRLEVELATFLAEHSTSVRNNDVEVSRSNLNVPSERSTKRFHILFEMFSGSELRVLPISMPFCHHQRTTKHAWACQNH